MKTRRLGKTGWDVSEVGLGCWQLGGEFGPIEDQRAQAILDTALELKVNFWDTADVYGGGKSESRIAAARPHEKGVKVATKLGRGGGMFPDNHTREGMRESLIGSARRLGVEQIDLAQLHCLPMEVLQRGEVFGWLEDFKREGLIAHYGASVETIAQGLECLKHEGVATLQIILNLFRQDAVTELLPLAREKGVGIIVRLPLASGLLTGKYNKRSIFHESDHRNYNRDGEKFFVGETFSGLPFEKGVELATELEKLKPHGWPLAYFSIRWCLDHLGVSTVIAGVSKPQQLRENVTAAARTPLPGFHHARINAFYKEMVRPHVRGEI